MKRIVYALLISAGLCSAAAAETPAERQMNSFDYVSQVSQNKQTQPINAGMQQSETGKSHWEHAHKHKHGHWKHHKKFHHKKCHHKKHRCHHHKHMGKHKKHVKKNSTQK